LDRPICWRLSSCPDIGDILKDDGLAVAETLGPSGHFTHLDVTDPDQWDAAVEAAVQRFGRLDALVNNAGIVKMAPLRGWSSSSDWQRVLDVNLTGTFLGMRAGIEPMMAGGGGSIVNISSVEGLAGPSSAYAGSPSRPPWSWRNTVFGSTPFIPVSCTPR
jgi:3alpha(or 20beta)-hydroxysteroid dehydrogenase